MGQSIAPLRLPAPVLDGSALIAWFRGKPAGVPVKELLQKASKAELVTGKPEFKAVEKQIKIRWLG